MLGAVIEAIGLGVLAWALWKEHDPTVYGMMVLTGVGIGIRLLPVPLHGMAYFPKRIAAVISLMEVSDPFGGTLGLTIMTTVLNNVAGVGDLGDLAGYDFTESSDMSEQEMEDLRQRAKKGIVLAFVAIFPFMVLCVIASAFLGNVYISTNASDEDEQSNVIYQGVFFWSWVRRKKIDESSHLATTTRRATWRGEQEMLPGVNASLNAEETRK
ncbi:MFS domain-containing protein [Fusarium sp. LHS14.1]|nr:MFS domain-containing protein [Fusarium sp. LHS14.1]